MIFSKGFRDDTFARRVEDDEVRLFFNLLKHFEDVAGKKSTVCDAVGGGIFQGGFTASGTSSMP